MSAKILPFKHKQEEEVSYQNEEDYWTIVITNSNNKIFEINLEDPLVAKELLQMLSLTDLKAADLYKNVFIGDQ